ncbi:MAG: AMP-binding protein [Deltaproteobacteria bacterium]|jgi:bile acid-coenzyme A ligase|nr:AMP-binding protein [Deltaproteobacteria bacterium]
MIPEDRESAAPVAATSSYGRRLEELAERDPDEILLVLEDREVSRRELDRRANRMARAFAEQGVTAGDTVTICAPNDLPFFVSCLAAWKLGAVPNPVPASLPAAERRAIIEEARPSLLFGVSANDPVTYAAIAGLLVVVALGATFIPARRATKIDPIAALRFE